MKKSILFLMLFVLMSACQPQVEQESVDEGAVQTAIAQTEDVEPTNTPLPPTETTVPTATEVPATETPANTPLPEGILFRDVFNGAIMPDWKIENEIPDRWSISAEGEVVIIATDMSMPYVWEDIDKTQDNLFLLPAPDNEFQVTTHIRTDLFKNFQQAAIIIYQDPDNFILLNRGFCDVCETRGDGVYMDYKIDGAQGGYKVVFKADDVYLRLVYTDGRYESYYAENEGDWKRLGMVGGIVEPVKMGFGASNAGAGEDLTAPFDYFEVSSPQFHWKDRRI